MFACKYCIPYSIVSSPSSILYCKLKLYCKKTNELLNQGDRIWLMGQGNRVHHRVGHAHCHHEDETWLHRTSTAKQHQPFSRTWPEDLWFMWEVNLGWYLNMVIGFKMFFLFKNILIWLEIPFQTGC